MSPSAQSSAQPSSGAQPAGPTAAQAKTERLLNLVCVLLYTRRPLTKQAIRGAVPQYGDAPTDEAFDRMFERDKDDLREIGIPIATEELDVLVEGEVGYRVHQRAYALPDIDFEPDEAAVLGLASRAWAHASLAGPAAQALRKLRASGVERDEESLIGIEPRLRTAEPAFDAVKDAVVSRTPVTFDYRRPEHSEATTRHVEPWSLISWHGRWYLNAFDTDRRAPRVFRLSRIEGAVRRAGRRGSVHIPEHDPQIMVRGSAGQTTPSPAVLRVRAGRGHALRRAARTVGEVDDTWSLLDIDYTDLDGFADDLAAHGPDVVVEQPVDLRDAVVRRLRAATEGHR